jgi:shikimate dehydrogenase
MKPRFFHLGLAGYPLGHSLSPFLHRAFFEACKLVGEYRLYPIPPGESQKSLPALLGRLRSGEIDGLNVTIPYKQTVISWLDELTDTARAAGAANTVFCRDGRLVGDNTDVTGFLADLERQGWDFRGKTAPRALVLGAGGAGRAVCLALVRSGWQVVVAARRLEQAQELRKSLLDASGPGIPGPSFAEQIIARSLPIQAGGLEPPPALIVNATPLGMFPAVDSSPWPEHLGLPANAIVYDLVYNPIQTALVRSARREGLRAASGLGMLAHQAALAFSTWTGQIVPPAAIEKSLEELQTMEAIRRS